MAKSISWLDTRQPESSATFLLLSTRGNNENQDLFDHDQTYNSMYLGVRILVSKLARIPNFSYIVSAAGQIVSQDLFWNYTQPRFSVAETTTKDFKLAEKYNEVWNVVRKKVQSDAASEVEE